MPCISILSTLKIATNIQARLVLWARVPGIRIHSKLGKLLHALKQFKLFFEQGQQG